MRILRHLPILIAALLLLAMGTARLTPVPPAEATTRGENGKIAYEFDGDIYEITPGTVGGTLLVADGSQPAWSPDGRRLAYIEDSQTLVVIDQNGANRMDILVTGAQSPSWSPDGNHIVFASSFDLFTVRPRSSTSRISRTLPTCVSRSPSGALSARGSPS